MMKQLEEQGNILITVLLVGLLIAALVFGGWAFQGRQDYKNNVDKKVAEAVVSAKDAQKASDAQKEAEDLKQPFRTYSGPSAFGSIQVKYPNTWSAYVDDSGKGSPLVNGYFQPSTVPAVSDTTAYALRVQVQSQAYSDVVSALSGQDSGTKPTIAPYTLKLVPSVVGVKVDGQISQGKTGSMVILPLRDKTLEISSEAPQYLGDFNNIILPNLTFSP